MPTPYEVCICGHIALHHEHDEHGTPDVCCVTVRAGQCPCLRFKRHGVAREPLDLGKWVSA
jgi:hypothetical protein